MISARSCVFYLVIGSWQSNEQDFLTTLIFKGVQLETTLLLKKKTTLNFQHASIKIFKCYI